MVLRFRTSQIFQFLPPSPLFRPELENFHSTNKRLVLHVSESYDPSQAVQNMKEGKEWRSTQVKEQNAGEKSQEEQGSNMTLIQFSTGSRNNFSLFKKLILKLV